MREYRKPNIANLMKLYITNVYNGIKLLLYHNQNIQLIFKLMHNIQEPPILNNILEPNQNGVCVRPIK